MTKTRATLLRINDIKLLTYRLLIYRTKYVITKCKIKGN